MCGIAILAGPASEDAEALHRMLKTLRHRGPDAGGTWRDPIGPQAALGHRRLSILDLSLNGAQPMTSADGRYTVSFNGEIYNFLELRGELGARRFRGGSDTEVLLEAWSAWGSRALGRFLGMFSFAIWDHQERTLTAVRDRFGVKPLYYAEVPGGLALASEPKALFAAGVPREPDPVAWAEYLSHGFSDHSGRTFWKGVRQVPPGHRLDWTPGGPVRLTAWYDVAAGARVAGPDTRPVAEVTDHLLSLLQESVRLRFRADVPVGVCLSGGLDSSLLVGLLRSEFGEDAEVHSFTFVTGDPAYDELPWVRRVLEGTRHPLHVCSLTADLVPTLADEQFRAQEEPFGGFPTLGMARVHAAARDAGVVVLLDGNGVDEGWAGYDYYARAASVDPGRSPVQAASALDTTGALHPDFAALAQPFAAETPFGDALLDLQYRDIRHAKLPRALRFNDRVSMTYSRELREPFLDHRLLELGLRQPADRKIRDGSGKWLVRQVASGLLGGELSLAPKRPVQTPQREWLRGPLRGWAEERIRRALDQRPDWFNRPEVLSRWESFAAGQGDNSFPFWQWISAGALL